jgi:capsular polysaccharide biosynthesis protein
LALLGRRWKFFGVAALLAVALTAGTYEAVKPQYQATTELLLSPPSISTAGMSGKSLSPYDSYGNLNTVASIVSYAMSSQQASDRLQSEGVTGTYTVGTDPTGAVPELILEVTASSPAAAIAQDKILSNDAIIYVQKSQELTGVNPKTYVTTQYLARPVNAPKDDKSRVRVAVAAGVVLVLLAVALTFLFDAMMRRRSSARDADEYEREVSRLRPADGFEQARAEDEHIAATGGRPLKRMSRPLVPRRASAPAHRAQDR